MGNAPEYMACRLSVKVLRRRWGAEKKWLQLHLEWSNGQDSNFAPGTGAGDAVVGLGMRAIAAERKLSRAESRIRKLEAELQQRDGQAPGWELDLVELRQLIQGVPNSHIGALLRTYLYLGVGG